MFSPTREDRPKGIRSRSLVNDHAPIFGGSARIVGIGNVVHLRHAIGAVGESLELPRRPLGDVEGIRGEGKKVPRTPYPDGAVQIRNVIVIDDHEAEHVGGHDGRRLEVRPHSSVGGIDLRSRRRHVRQRRVIGVVLYGEFEGRFPGQLVPARKRLSRVRRLEMRYRQWPVNSL